MAAPASPGLVIFDCDGVLVDSEVIALDTTRDLLAEAGCPLTRQQAHDRLLGRSIGSVAGWLEAEHDVRLTPEHLQKLRHRLIARFRAELVPMPGVHAAVSALTARVCVASSSSFERIALSLSLTGLEDLFAPNLFSAEMVARGKPAPDLFEHAAAQMGVAPGDCVVVEDSPTGIRAAQAAGMRVIAFTGGAHAGAAGLREAVANLNPDAIIAHMAELPARLQVEA